MASPPRLRAFHFCDGVVKDPVTGKTTLVGIFDTLYASEYPAPPQPFVVYVALAGLNGRYRFEVEIVSDDLQSVIRRAAIASESGVDDPLATFEVTTQLDDISWPSAGRYTVRLRYNGRLLEDATLTVEDMA